MNKCEHSCCCGWLVRSAELQNSGCHSRASAKHALDCEGRRKVKWTVAPLQLFDY